MQDTVKVWDKILSMITFDYHGNDPFDDRECLNSAMTLLHYGLAEKINFGLVFIWDTSEQCWETFYAWHCWGVTKEGQPIDLSVPKWINVFNFVEPHIIPEKNPMEMSCEVRRLLGNFDINDRTITKANVIYLNGGIAPQHFELIPERLKQIILLSGKENGFTLEQSEKVFKFLSNA